MAPSVSIRNFGPVAQANIDIMPLSILIGPNGSGKSYVALAIYSLTRAIRDSLLPFGRQRGIYRRIPTVRAQSAQERRHFTTVLSNAKEELESFLSGQSVLQDMPSPLKQLVYDQCRNRTEAISGVVDYELRRCFGITLDGLGRRSRYIERGEFEIDLADQSTDFRWGMRCRNDSLIMTDWNPGSSFEEFSLDPGILPPAQVLLDEPEMFLHFVIDALSKPFLSDFSVRSHYLPASRSGILQGHKTLTGLIVGRASRAWIEPMDVATLPGVITDLIEALLDLGRPNPRSRPPRLSRIVEFLESNVTEGSIDVENLADYPDINYQNQGGSFKLHEVSSMVSEIAPLVLFLKYLTRPSDLFIFEEPESHLDPANQRNLARAVAMMVNVGIKVLVTTHSDIFLNQINNLMQLPQMPARTRSRMGYRATEALDPAKVGVYLFDANPESGSQVNRLPVDSKYGISTDSFDTVHRALYDEAIRLEHRVRT